MEFRFKLIIKAICFLVFSQGVFAAGNNTGQLDISHIKVGSEGVMVQFKTANFAVDNEDCRADGENKSKTVALIRTNSDFSELYAAIMLAHSNDRLIAFWVNGCDSTIPGGPHPTVESVYVY